MWFNSSWVARFLLNLQIWQLVTFQPFDLQRPTIPLWNWKDLELVVKIVSDQETDNIWKIGFALSKSTYLHKAYVEFWSRLYVPSEAYTVPTPIMDALEKLPQNQESKDIFWILPSSWLNSQVCTYEKKYFLNSRLSLKQTSAHCQKIVRIGAGTVFVSKIEFVRLEAKYPSITQMHSHEENK